ncbi:MAG: hypothetical protein N3A66_05520 [Planctomycetota bacterium]|nr:hypothetical protein [Planctomycetota bacterium]
MSVSRYSGDKENAGESRAEMAERWLETLALYRREIAVAGLIILGAAAIYAAVSHMQETSEEKAWEDIFRAAFAADNASGARIADSLAEAAAKHQHSQAAFYALMREVEARHSEGDLRRAESAARDLLERYPRHPLAGQVHLWLGQILLAKGAAQDAQQELEAAMKSAPAYLLPEIRLALAHSLMRQAEATVETAGRKRAFEAALEAYMKVAQEGEAQGWPPQLVQIAAFGRLAAEDRLRELASPTPKAEASAPAAAGEKNAVPPAIAIERSSAPQENAGPAESK